MKKQLPLFILIALYVLLSQAAKALPVNVQKQPGSNELTGNLVVPSGLSIIPTGSGSIVATSLAGTYTGQTSITTLGIISTGVWNGTPIPAGFGGTGLTALGSGVATFLGTPSSANLRGAISDETGTQFAVFSDSPVFTTQITAPKVVFTGSVFDISGSGSPEGVVTAAVGSVYRRTNGGASTTLYVKESGSGNTGWVAYGTGSGTIAAGTAGDLAVYTGTTAIGSTATPQISKLGIGIAPTANRPIYLTPTSTTATFFGYGLHLGGTITATANNDTAAFMAIGDGAATFSTSTFTGLTKYMLKVTGATIGGSSNITDNFGIYVSNGTGGTNNWDFYSASQPSFFQGVVMETAKPLSIKSGTNQRAGNATLSGGTVTVSNTTVTANTIVMLTRKTNGGTIGTGITYTISAGSSFTIDSDNILDTSVFSYLLIEVP